MEAKQVDFLAEAKNTEENLKILLRESVISEEDYTSAVNSENAKKATFTWPTFLATLGYTEESFSAIKNISSQVLELISTTLECPKHAVQNVFSMEPEGDIMDDETQTFEPVTSAAIVTSPTIEGMVVVDTVKKRGRPAGTKNKTVEDVARDTGKRVKKMPADSVAKMISALETLLQELKNNS